MDITTDLHKRNAFSPPVGNVTDEYEPYALGKLAKLFVLHIILGIIMRSVPIIATLHAGAVGLVVFYFVLSQTKLHRYLMVIAYVASCEVLWRMTGAMIPWMYAEYLVLFTILLGLMRIEGNRKSMFLPLYYLILLFPSVLITFFDNDLETARQGLVFNLAGPVTLGLGMFTVSRFSLEQRLINKALIYALFPVMSIVTITFIAVFIVGVDYHAFSESNADAAGGYSPNQVSSMISFGIILLFFLVFLAHEYKHARKLFLTLIVIFIIQMLLTLSRGGTFNTAMFIIFGLPFFLQSRQSRYRFVMSMVVVFVVMWAAVLPGLDDLTSGGLSRRYQDESTTHRAAFMESELQAWRDSPIVGHGPGNAYVYLSGTETRNIHSHTEYTRVLAEHGIIGAVGMLLLALTFVVNFFNAKDTWRKGVILGFAAWIFTYFTHSASRTVQFAFLGIISTLVVHSTLDDEEQESASGD